MTPATTSVLFIIYFTLSKEEEDGDYIYPTESRSTIEKYTLGAKMQKHLLKLRAKQATQCTQSSNNPL